MKKAQKRKLSKRTVGLLIIAVTMVYLFATVTIAQEATVRASKAQMTYNRDPLSYGDVWTFGGSEYDSSKYKNQNSNVVYTYYTDKQGTSSSSYTGDTATSNGFKYYGKITTKDKAGITESESVKLETYPKSKFYNESVQIGSVASPLGLDGVTIPVATVASGTGVYTIVPNASDDYRIYVYSESGDPSSKVHFALLEDYITNNAFDSQLGITRSFTNIEGTNWYFTTVEVHNLSWSAFEVAFSKASQTSNTDDKGTGTHTGSVSAVLTTTYYYFYNQWTFTEHFYNTVLSVQFDPSVKLGPITRGENFLINNPITADGRIITRNIFGEVISFGDDTYHTPLYLEAVPSGSAEFSGFVDEAGIDVSVSEKGTMFEYLYEEPATLRARWEVKYPYAKVQVSGGETKELDFYLTRQDEAAFSYSTDTTFNFAADYYEGALTEPIQYTVKENGIVIKSGTLSIDNTTFAVTAKWETLLVTFTSSHDSKQVEMAYTIKPSTAGMTPVARIGTTAGQNEYYFLEDALTASNSGVSGNIVLLTDYTMYSGSNPRVAWSNNDNGYTLKSGIRLLIPYSTDTYNTDHSSAPNFHTNSYAAPTCFRKLTLTPNTKLTIYGTLVVDGSLAAKGQNNGYNGSPSGPHGRIVMPVGSSISVESGGTLTSWGFITAENTNVLSSWNSSSESAVHIKSGATLRECFSIRDWPGGSNASSTSVFPFNQYYIQNVEVPLRIDSGASEYVTSCVYAASSLKKLSNLQFIGGSSAGMFRLSSGYFIRSYDATTDRIIYDAYGAMTIHSISFKLYISISSTSYILPINGNMTINVHSGSSATLYSSQAVEMLPGAQVNIDQSATLTIPNTVYFYDADDWLNGYTYSGTKLRQANYVAVRNAAPVTRSSTVDATLNINGAATVSGKLYTSPGGANITSSQKTGSITFSAAPPTSNATISQNTDSAVSATMNPARLHNGTGTDYTPTAGAAANTTYTYCSTHNRWEKSPVTVTFNANGGAGAMDPLSVHDGQTQQLTANTFTREHYTFAGWNTETDGTGTPYADQADITPTANTTLYAQWTGDPVTISFNGNQSSGMTVAGVIASINTTYGQQVELPENTFVAEGYTFNGWNTVANPNAQHPGVSYADKATLTAESTITLYAQWKQNHVHNYSPVWSWDEANGGGYNATLTLTCSGEDCDAKTLSDTTFVEDGEVTIQPTCTDSGVKTYSATITLNGVSYTDSYEVEIPAAGHSYGKPSYVWTQHDDGWYCSATAVCTVDPSHPKMEETVKAVVDSTTAATCEEKGSTVYKATFTEPFTEQTKSVPIPALGHDWGMPTWTWTEDYSSATATFTCTRDNSHARSVTDAAPVTSQTEATTTYTATVNFNEQDFTDFVDVAREYIVTFVDENGQELQSSQLAYGTTPEYSGTTPTKAADAQYTYTFKGWTPEITFVTGDVTYTATFTETVNTYIVTFDENGHGTAPETQTVAYGSKVAKPDDLTDSGWIFGGWYKEAACTNAWDFASDTVNGTTTIYAKWTEKTALTAADFTVTGNEYTYDGTAKTADVTVKTGIGEITAVEYYQGETAIADPINAGEYTVKVNVDESDGYKAVNGLTVGTLAIGQKAATVTADAMSKTYGDADPTLTASVTGLVGSDKLIYTLTRADGENVGEYVITVTLGENPNYDVTAVPRTFAITARSVNPTATLAQTEYTYDGSAKEPAVTLKDGSKIIPAEEYTVAYSTNQDAGEATVTVTDKEGGNYSFEPIALHFTIINAEQAAPVGVADHDETIYGKTDGSISGLSAAMEWSADDETYTAVENAELANLAAGTYYVRYAAKTNYNASPAVTIVIDHGRLLTITWVDGDGKTLKTNSVVYRYTPVYEGATPTKTSDEAYTYTFNNTWAPEIVAAEADATYTAQFDRTENVARIGERYYTSLADAIDGAAAGDTITVIQDFTIDESKTEAADRIVITTPVTIDFGKHTMYVPGSLEPTSNWAALFVDANTTIKATTGGIDCLDKENGGAGVYTFNVRNNATLTVESGSYHGGGTIAQAQLGTVAVTGGTFNATPFEEPYGMDFVFNCSDSAYIAGTARIQITGGTFDGFDPQNNAAEGAGTRFTPANYVALDPEGDGSYVVQAGGTVMFDLNGGTGDFAEQRIASGGLVTEPDAVPIKVDYVFKEWQLDGAAYDFSEPVTGDFELVAAYNEAVARIDNQYYATLAEAVAAAQSGDTVELLTDSSAELVKIGKSLTLDLGGKTFKGRVTIDNGTVTVQNGAITGRFDTYDTAVVTLAEDAIVNGQAVVWGDGTFGESGCKTPMLNVYGTITNTGDSAISTNGTDKSGANINIYDGAAVTSEDEIGIYLPSGNLAMSGGEVTGTTAIYAKSGSVTISGGTITGTGEEAAYTFNGNGGNATGDALVIDTCGYPNGDPTVNVTGGTFISEHAQAVASYATEGNTAAAGFVSGGEFSEPVDPKYAADGLLCTTTITNENNMYYIVDKVTVTFDLDGALTTVELPKGQTVIEPETPTKANFVFKQWSLDGKKFVFTTPVEADITLVAAWNQALAKVDDVYYTTLSAAIKAVKGTSGKTVEWIGGDTTLTGIMNRFALADDQDFTLDLGGSTLTMNGAHFTLNGANLTVVNGTISAKGNFSQEFTVNSGTLTIGEDAAVIGTGTISAVAVFGPATINTSGTLRAENTFALAGNGSDGKGGYTLNVTGGEITSANAPAIYHPNSGTLTISGGNITGTTAVYQKSGSLTITDGTLTATGAANDYAYNGNGANSTGDALVIDACGYPGGAPSASVTGGTFISQNGQAIASYAYGDNTAVVGFVQGGEFNTVLDEAVVADGKLCTTTQTNANGYYYIVAAVTVTFDSSGGSEVEAVILPAGETIESPVTERTGYTFVEWLLGGEAFDFTTPVTEDIRLTAKWSAIPYTITWKNDDGMVIDTTTVLYDDMPTHENAVKADDADYHYIFSAWSPVIESVTGNAIYTATYATTARTYGAPVWTWDGTTSAEAAFTTNDAYSPFTLTETAVGEAIDLVTVDETCEQDGLDTYTATVTFRGADYTDDKEVVRPAMGHNYEYQYIWSADNSRVIARRVCTHDASHTDFESVETTGAATLEGSCGTGGEYTYTAVFTAEYFETQTKVVGTPQIHVREPAWVWLDDRTAFVEVRCRNCGELLDTIAADISIEVTEAAACSEPGEQTITASANYNGETLTDARTAAIPAAGHTLAHVAAKEATCAAPGNSEYWTCEVCGKAFSDEAGTNELAAEAWVIAATAHTYGEPAWNWSDDHSRATASFTCTVCGHVETVNASIAADEVQAAEGMPGSITYTATVELNGEIYTDEQTVVTEYMKLDYPNFTILGVTETFRPECREDIIEITDTLNGRFTVTYDQGCLVAVRTVENGEECYTRLIPTGENGDTHTFDLSQLSAWDSDIDIVVAVKGDVNSDGKINALDAAQVKSVSISKIEFSGFKMLVCDVNGDGKINALDAAQVKSASISKLKIRWDTADN